MIRGFSYKPPSSDNVQQNHPTGRQPLGITAGPTEGIQPRNRRLVYPYSVVPGGVNSPAELQDVAAHDPVVAEHYAGFNYKRARLVEVTQPQTVYLSYRRHGHVFWTTKQATLRKGEKLLTDGRISARTRCGNQVSALPQARTSPEEPTIAELESPDALASGMEQLFPSKLNNNVLSVDPGIPGAPLSPPGSTAGNLPSGGGLPFPGGGGGPPISGGCPSKSSSCTPPPPPPPPPPTVPEPGTIVLVLSGAAAVCARVRSRKA